MKSSRALFTAARSFAVKRWMKASPLKWNVMFIDSKFDTFICKNYKLIMLKFKIIFNIIPGSLWWQSISTDNASSHSSVTMRYRACPCWIVNMLTYEYFLSVVLKMCLPEDAEGSRYSIVSTVFTVGTGPLWGLGTRDCSLSQRTYPSVRCVLVAVSFGCEAHHFCPSSNGTGHSTTCHEGHTALLSL